ncbi:hypothetical protein D9M09_18025 [Janthinobacterium agaricidamnosum]|uniref:Uncharacterized protein n=1 Tax=Janthinobacterium agaricidamnosum TaxID=55508 RepID=A0A3G2EC83_9BURK|nr:hypothetical protein [Janthinobacterium agaricidamnosum]AYM77480.1 hypothetical protein D9M09_18025 [Janthinobacterium agaricidamnosum]
MAEWRRTRRLIGSLFLAACASSALAAADPGLESGLIQALHLKKGTTDRVGTSGKAIAAYMREGYIGKHPDQRFDYTDYYLLKKPAGFMGHALVLIEEEYITQYIGCCVSPGAGVTLKVQGSTQKLQAFAIAQRCTLTDPVDIGHALSEVAIQARLPQGHYASLSCRERDAEREEP